MAIGDAYKTSWEQTRLIANSLGQDVQLPWDNQPTAAERRRKTKKATYKKAAALNVAAKLKKSNENIHLR